MARCSLPVACSTKACSVNCAHGVGRAQEVDLQRIAALQRHAVDADLATDHVDVRIAPGGQLMLQAVARGHDGGVDRRVLVDQHRAFAAVAGGDQAQPALLCFGVKCFSS
jgi:hypothetical protein